MTKTVTKKQILYEDASLIAVDKPSGMLVLPDRWQREKGATLIDWCRARYEEKIYIVHRLDRDTSGIVIFAKQSETHRALCRMFEKREIQKIYFGLVHGGLSKDQGIIDKPIAPCRRVSGLMIVDKRTGKPSVTRVEVLKRFQHYSWLKIMPETGRTHQIRVHLASIGHPLVCDRFYGLLHDDIYLSHIKKKYKKKRITERPLLSRLALHAGELAFRHPATSKPLVLRSPLPKELKAAIRQLLLRSAGQNA